MQIKPLLSSIVAIVLAFGSATPSFAAPPIPTSAFEQAFATSLFVFDACGDDLAGDKFRQVLAAKMALCPIPADAVKRYQQHTALLLKKERDWIKDFVEEHGGLPDRIEGMSATCPEHQKSPDYVQLREKLDAYVDGKTDPNVILPGGCDAAVFSPSGP